MRIQHNIMAMSAYRNYTNNVSAMKKNLEKLSSGYKINRAGDDAAGLAISEKMRAQITGLETAQKNAKDGISLVQTAEGALTEVHDMLNRMVELATMSANGTYDNETDRAQLQKEMDQLTSEINRIADSSNFNGIKLLDGTMDASSVLGAKYNGVSASDLMKNLFVNTDWTGTGEDDVVGGKNVLETEGGAKSSAGFQISLDGTTAVLGKGEAFNLNIGKATMSTDAAAADGTKMTSTELAKALDGKTVKLTGSDGKEHEFTAKADGNVLTFTTTDTADFKLNTNAAVSWTVGDGKATDTAPTVKQPTADTATINDGVDGVSEATIELDLAGFDVDKAGTVVFNVGGKDYEVEITEDEVAAKDTTSLDKVAAGKLVTAMNAEKLTDANAGAFTAAAAGDTGIKLTSANKKTIASDDIKATAYSVKAKEADAAGGADGNAMIMTLEDPADGADTGSPASLEVTTSITGTLATNDFVEFSSTGGTTDLSLKFTYDGSDWTLDSSTKAPDGYTATFDGSKLTLTATGNGKVDASPFGTVSVNDATIAGNTSASSAVSITDGTGSWTAGADPTTPTDPTDPTDPDKPGDTEKPTETTTVSKELTASGVDFADKANKLDDAAISAIKALKEITVDGTFKVDVSNIQLTANTNTGEDAAKAILKLAQDAADVWNKANSEAEGYKYENIRISKTADGADGDIIAQAAGDKIYILADKVPLDDAAGDGATSYGTINSGLQNVTDNNSGASAQLANTVVDFSKVDAWKDGAKLTIGDTTYTVAVGEASKFKNAENVIDLTDLAANDKDLAKIAAQRLTVAAKNNGVFTVGHDGTGKTTLQQKSAVKESTDMTTKEKVAGYLGVSLADPDSLVNAKAGSGLRLQIGDTAESYNQLTVSIKDMHASSLGISGLSIANQDSAAAAMDKIKAAINQVSDVRGTLGATQNRLDHTINNLSVMTENIQDAESTIRDTDVADEMMAYTKNNILIQSAQAMLAQANQVPQGVLQLLQ